LLTPDGGETGVLGQKARLNLAGVRIEDYY
jgi:hypothetical protein